MNLNLLVYKNTRVLRVHEQARNGHGVLHALLHGRSVRGVKDEVQRRGFGVVVECK